MKTREVVTGLIVLIILISGVLIYKNSLKNKSLAIPTPTPNFQKIESKFPSLNVPTNADKANLNAASGVTGMGEAFRTFVNGKYSLTVMADLPTPKPGSFYQTWIVKDKIYLSVGRMTVSKGGYLIDYSSTKDYTGYSKVVVTQEKVLNSTPETTLLEGSF